MSDDRGWYPNPGRGGRGDDGRPRDPERPGADRGPEAPRRDPRDRQPPAGGRRQAPYRAEPSDDGAYGGRRPQGYGPGPVGRDGERVPWSPYDPPSAGRRDPVGRDAGGRDSGGRDSGGRDSGGRDPYGRDSYGGRDPGDRARRPEPDAPGRDAPGVAPRRDERPPARGAVDTWNAPGNVPPQGRSGGGGRRAGRPAPEEDAWAPEETRPVRGRAPGGYPDRDPDRDFDRADDRDRDFDRDADADSARPRYADYAESGSEGRRSGRAGAGGRGSRAGAAAVEGNINEDLDLDELDPSGRAARGGRGPASGPKARRRKIIKWTAIGVASVLVAVLAVGAYFVEEFTGNIQHDSLLQNGESQAPEAVNKFGESAMNILIIGSDTRDTAADCSLGGACVKGAGSAVANAGANADVEMVVHLSADRTNATVMSIPRDTITTLPACTNPTTGAKGGGGLGQINSTLDYGPSCTVEAVHDLTGLTIDHFMMVDFSGVVTMSDALGGVPVCVSNTMYDKDSGLRLNKGTTVVKGQQALEFVRTRHGFYDGSDLGREKAQHYFLSAMIREMRQNLNLTSVGTLISIANAATKALTVDDGLSGVTSLVDLAETLNKVPTDKITFVTMPWEYDPTNNNRVVPLYPEATQMFQNIKGDISYTAVKPAATAAAAPSASPVVIPSPTVAVDVSTVHVQVQNGGGVAGRASTVTTALTTAGFSDAADGGNANPTATTMLYYPSSRADSAAAVAHTLGIPTTHMQVSSAYSEVTVVIGSDWTSGSTFAAGSASASPTGAASAPADSSAELASTTGGCIPVNPADIVR